MKSRSVWYGAIVLIFVMMLARYWHGRSRSSSDAVQPGGQHTKPETPEERPSAPALRFGPSHLHPSKAINY